MHHQEIEETIFFYRIASRKIVFQRVNVLYSFNFLAGVHFQSISQFSLAESGKETIRHFVKLLGINHWKTLLFVGRSNNSCHRPKCHLTLFSKFFNSIFLSRIVFEGKNLRFHIKYLPRLPQFIILMSFSWYFHQTKPTFNNWHFHATKWEGGGVKKSINSVRHHLKSYVALFTYS